MALSDHQQIRPLGLIALAIALLVLVVETGRWMLSARPAAMETLPPDAFRPTREQLAQLKFTQVGTGANATLLRANGS
ncbi:hypothetical protein ABTH30_23280, partial [Acinetobacter baumannii]